MTKIVAMALFLFAAELMPVPCAAQNVDEIPRSYIELLRGDIKNKKREIISAVVPVSKEQEDKFWSLYRSFDADLDKITDDRVRLLQDFNRSWDNMTDAQASDQARRALKLMEDRAKLNRKYYSKFEKEFSPLLAAKLFQVEYQLQTALDYQRVSSLPLIK